MSATVKIVLGLLVVVTVAVGAVVWLGDAGEGSAADGEAVSIGASGTDRRTELPDAVEGGRSRLTSADAPAAGLADPGAVALGAEAPDAAAVELPQAQLLGRVVDEAGRPVPEARVVFHRPETAFLIGSELTQEGVESPPETQTGSDGRFALQVPVSDRTRRTGTPDFLGEGLDRLAVGHPSMQTTVKELPELVPEEIDVGDVVMSLGARVAGRVVDESGRAVAGAKVTGRQGGGVGGGFTRMISGNLAATLGSATSGADGRFVVTGLGSGDASLVARAEGRQQTWVGDLTLEAGLTEEVGDVVMAAGEAISGIVVDADAAPVEGAVVRVSSMTRLVVRSFDEAPKGPGMLGNAMDKSARTDAQGWFELAGLAPGQYTVHATHDDFARGERPNVPAGTRDVRVTMARLGRLLVSLRDGVTGEPIDGANLTARGASSRGFVVQGGAPLPVLSGRAALTAAGLADEDPEGLYLVQGATTTGTELAVVADGFAALDQRAPGVPSGELGRHVVELSPESRITGVVRGEGGQPVPGAVVSLTEFVPQTTVEGGSFSISREVVMHLGDDAPQGIDWRRAESDDEGRFVFSSLPAGDWELSARADGFAGSDEPVVELGEGEVREDVLLSLRPGGDLAGVVLDADGVPVSGAEVRVKPTQAASAGGPAGLPAALIGMLGGSSGDQRTARADGEGRFQVEGLLPGDYEVSLGRASGFQMGGSAIVLDGMGGGGAPPTSERVVVVAGEETWVELVKPPTAGLTGRVTAAGRPVEGARVQLEPEDSFLPFGGPSVETDAYGDFSFEDVEPGRYEVSSLVDGAALPEKVGVELEGGRVSRADLIFDGATVSGRVVDADTGDGVPGVTINVIPVKSAQAAEPQRRMAFAVMTSGPGGGGGGMEMSLGGGPLSKVRSGPDGSFAVRFLDAGRYTFETQGGGYTKSQAGPVVLKDQRELDGVVIEAVRGAVLAGVVTDGDTGQPLEGVPVSLSAMGAGGMPEMSLTENGRYRFDGLAAGDYAVTVQGSGFGGPPLASEVVTLGRGEERLLDLTTTDPGPNMQGGEGMFWSGAEEVELEIEFGAGGH